MVLYHLSTTYQLLYCIVHRLARHADEEAGLLMVEYIRPESERKAFIQKLLDTGWFPKINSSSSGATPSPKPARHRKSTR